MNDALVISKGSLQKDQLGGKIALITGAGGGIGFEAARSLIWLGVTVIIVDIDKHKGKTAAAKLKKEFGPNTSIFMRTDIGKERQVKSLAKKVYRLYGHLDIILNNATVAPIGAVQKVGIRKWDLSYRTNLRGPVLLLEYFLPKMLERNTGVIAFVPSSGAAPYMGAYEVFKTSQVELSNTLSGELEGTGVITYSIGPGIVKTDTAQKAISEVAPLYGKSEAEFYKMSEHVLLTADEAGAGFAASVALANNYSGLEISSSQALTDIGVTFQDKNDNTRILLQTGDCRPVLEVLYEIRQTFSGQVDGWKSRSVFERQWVLRDFKKYTGAAPEYFIDKLKEFYERAQNNELSKSALKELPVDKIALYYKHQIDLLKSYEKNPEKVKEYSQLMENWIDSIERFKELVREMIEKC
jgi:NAD(P)-dependent dehydrogenase (short-subunit alcohol dehydrogenase family)